jgi:hypothetical protein
MSISTDHDAIYTQVPKYPHLIWYGSGKRRMSDRSIMLQENPMFVNFRFTVFLLLVSTTLVPVCVRSQIAMLDNVANQFGSFVIEHGHTERSEQPILIFPTSIFPNCDEYILPVRILFILS